MSLLDALLPDPYRDKREVWIALRSDGQRGSGTIADPYDGSTRLGTPLGATLTCNRREFLFGNGFPHNLTLDSEVVVTIKGCEGLGKAWFNITALAKVVSPFHLALLANNPNDTGLPPAPPDVRYVRSITASWNGLTPAVVRMYWPVAKVTTDSVPHGLPTFGAVDVGGIPSPNDPFMGIYPALGVSADGRSFYYRIGFFPENDIPSLSVSSLSCTITPRHHRFDEAVRLVPPSSVIHLGPGTFETRGRSSVYFSTNPATVTQLHVGCLLRSGQRWLGSGLGVSTLKLVLPVDDLGQIVAIGTLGDANYADVADLTVDANGPGHAAPFGIFPAPVTCGGVSLVGRFITLRRVRAIGFCTQAPGEGFPLYLDSASSSSAIGNVIEDCIVEQPSPNNTHETTLIGNVGNHYGNAVSPVVRHNYLNCRYAANAANPEGVSTELLWIESITYGSGDTEALVTTKRPHNRTTANNAALNYVRQKLYNNAVPPQQTGVGNSVFIATFPILAVLSAREFKIRKPAGAPASTDLIFFSDGIYAALGVDFHGPGAGLGTGCVTEGNAVYDCYRAFYSDTGVTRDAVVRDNYYSNIGRAVDLDYNPVGGGVSDPILARTGVNLLTLTHDGMTAHANSGSPTTGVAHGLTNGETVQISGARIGNSSAPSGTYNGVFPVAVVDQYNFTYLMASTPTGGDGGNADTPTTNNPVFVGIYSLKRDASNPRLATFEIAAGGSLLAISVDDVVTVGGARLDGGLIPDDGLSYNGTFSVVSVSSDKRKFSYLMKLEQSDDADPPTLQTPIIFRSRWQVRRLAYEGNACDFYPVDSNTAPHLFGATTLGYAFGPPFMFPQAVYRDNIFRLIDDTPAVALANGTRSWAFNCISSEQVLVEGNLVGLADAHLLTYSRSRSRNVNAFNNLTTAGVEIPLYAEINGPPLAYEQEDSLEDKVREALLFSLL